MVPRTPVPVKIQAWKSLAGAEGLATRWKIFVDRKRDEFRYRRWILYQDTVVPFRQFLRNLLAKKPVAFQDTPALLGMPLSIARNETNFFGFFNLEPVGSEEPVNDGVFTTFKPTGPTFHELVTLQVGTDRAGVIRDLRLCIARTFIDDPKSGIFAADIARSFLLSSVGASGYPRASTLALEIGGRARTIQPFITHQRSFQTELPKHPSPGYQIYRGKDERHQIALAKRIEITLSNVREESGLFFQMRVTTRRNIFSRLKGLRA